jgi:hypothetical protein
MEGTGGTNKKHIQNSIFKPNHTINGLNFPEKKQILLVL